MKKLEIVIVLAGFAFVLGGCASKKAVVGSQTATTLSTSTKTTTTKTADSKAVSSAAYVKKVIDAQVYAKNVVSDMTFNLQVGSKDISVPGSVHMRRDEVIRMQLFIPLLGTEVGRIEFTPSGVLVIDRIHKEYIEASYNQLDFLKNNGLNFYSLQALFWNQLMVPGEKQVSDNDLTKFEVPQAQGTSQNVKLQKGNMTYNWTTQPPTGQIVMTNVNYASASSGASSLLWTYSDFKSLGTKKFPAHQEIQFSTSASKKIKNAKVVIDMDSPKDKSDWETKTTVSSKYKKVEATDIIGKLLRF
ncbi:MAG: DUF4292 domain-containing protein [Prevotella sp.]|nr:DUF4292 domain-containing protein [Prevotella sp.]